MSYTVERTPSAEQELARLWTPAADRADVAAAADTLDLFLQRDPLAAGESRGGDTRIAFQPPLAILFDVDGPNRRVTVWDVWRWPP
jgi:hypothetical protein